MRETKLQQLLDHSRRVIMASGNARAMAAAERVFDRLEARQGATGAVTAQRLPVCLHNIDAALDGLAARPSPLSEIGATFTALEPQFAWYRRRTAQPGDEPFYSSHANAILVGPGGLEERDDVWVGATIMAPQLVYPDHDHPPEEVYIALSRGEWWNSEMDWMEPGVGGIVYNPPGIFHAMRSHAQPLLALWFLPI